MAQVFGNSGTRPFREVASEADTSKRASTSISQEAAHAVPAKFAPLEALATAMSEARIASDKSHALVQMVLALDEVRTCHLADHLTHCGTAFDLLVVLGLFAVTQAVYGDRKHFL